MPILLLWEEGRAHGIDCVCVRCSEGRDVNVYIYLVSGF